MGKLTYTTAQVQYLLDEVAKINAAVIIDNGEVASLEFKNDTKLQYNYVLDTLEIEYANGTTLQIGREQTTFVYNNTGSAIPNGTPVYYSGVGGDVVTVPLIAPADASNLATAMVKGWATIDIPNDSYGIIVCKGELTVPSHGYSVGNKLYLAVGGGATTTPPSNPNVTVELGIVLDEDTLHVYPCIISPFSTGSTSLNSQLFLSDTASGIGTYKTLARSLDSGEITETLTANSSTSPFAGKKYISDELGVTSIPASVFLAHSTCKVDSNVGTTQLRLDLSLYHADNTTTLIASDISTDINFTEDTPVEFSVPFGEITCVETDRLLVEIYLLVSTATNKTFTYYVGNGRATYITIPLPISHTDLNNLNGDPDFQHVTDSQITAFGNKVDGPASSIDNSVPVFDGITGKLLKDSAGVSIVDGNFVMSNTSSIISTNTTDGLDNKRIQITGGGGVGNSRGAYIELMGNELPGAEGNVGIYAGNAAVGTIRFYTGAANEKMRITKEGIVGIGTSNPITGSRLDVSDGGLSINIGADAGLTTRTNLTNKVGRITSMHYTNTEEPVMALASSSNETENLLQIGGGSSLTNTQSRIMFYTAANNNTLSGTERMRITAAGNVGISTSNPSEKLHVIGNILASGDSASATKTIANKVRMEYDSATDTLEFNFI